MVPYCGGKGGLAKMIFVSITHESRTAAQIELLAQSAYMHLGAVPSVICSDSAISRLDRRNAPLKRLHFAGAQFYAHLLATLLSFRQFSSRVDHCAQLTAKLGQFINARFCVSTI